MKIKGIKWEKYQKIKTPEEKEDEPSNKTYFDLELDDSSEGIEFPDPMENVDFTPFGEFHRYSPLNPHNMYEEMYWGYLIGDSINSYNFISEDSTFYSKIDYIEGISAWKPIDPHRIIVVPAKFYDWDDVRKKIETELCLDPDSNENKIIRDCHKISMNLSENHFVLALPNDKIIFKEATHDKYEDFLTDALKIFEKEEQSYLIINGEPHKEI